jgi:L-fuconolactonase
MQGAAMDPVRRRFAPSDLAPILRAVGIDGTVLVQTASSESETREFLELAAEHGFVRGVVGWVDLTAGDVADRIDALRESAGGDRLVGIRHQVHDEPDSRWLCRDDVHRGLRAIRDRGLTYDLLVRARELPAAIETVTRFADLGFVVDHIAKPRIIDGFDPAWEDHMKSLATLPNVQAKVSGMITEANWHHWTPNTLRPFVDRVLEWFGPERLMFGSDWPVCLLAAPSYENVLGTAQTVLDGLSASESQSVFGANAERFYRLGVTSRLAEGTQSR